MKLVQRYARQRGQILPIKGQAGVRRRGEQVRQGDDDGTGDRLTLP